MTSAQQPINSGYTAASTADDVISGIDLTGRVAVVTGGYSGIGLVTVRSLRRAGATVIVPARDLMRAAAALQGEPNVQIWPMDLLDPRSIDAFTARFIESGRALHILINCAGIMAVPMHRDHRGYEMHFATNHLGHFQLTTQLYSTLRAAGNARVVSVSSWGHRYSPVVFDDIHFANRPYDRWAAYGQSKTANALFAVALDQRGGPDGVRAFSVHPGNIAATRLGKHLSREELIAAGSIDQNGEPVFTAKGTAPGLVDS